MQGKSPPQLAAAGDIEAPEDIANIEAQSAILEFVA